MKKFSVVLLLGLFVLGITGAANSATIAGYTLHDNAFVDEVLDYAYTYNAGYIVGSDVDYSAAVQGGGWIRVGFTDNVLENFAGADVVFFEVSAPNGGPESLAVSLSVGGDTVQVDPVDSGFFAPGGGKIHVGTLDLTDLGLSLGETIDSLVIYSAGEQTPDVAAVAGMATPIPSTLLLLASGLTGMAVWRRRS